MSATHAQAATEKLRILSLANAKGLNVRFVRNGNVYDDLDILVQDSRITSQRDAALPYPSVNQAQETDGFTPGSWNRYEVGAAVSFPNSQVTFV